MHLFWDWGLIMKLLLTAVLATGLLAALPSVAYAKSCYDLWYERNEIYAEHGYCFVTQLAIDTFGNDDCYTKNPKFSHRVLEIAKTTDGPPGGLDAMRGGGRRSARKPTAAAPSCLS